jgi:hypothetical protein
VTGEADTISTHGHTVLRLAGELLGVPEMGALTSKSSLKRARVGSDFA